MTTAQEVLSARQRAIAEVDTILKDLDTDALLKAEQHYSSLQHANSKQLRNCLTAYTDSLQTGLSLLEASSGSVARLEASLQEINALSEESKALIDSNEEIQRLSIVSSNLTATLHEVEIIATLPAHAAEAEKLLYAEGGALLQAYQSLVLLEITIYRVEKNWKASVRSSQKVDLAGYHVQIENAMRHLEDRLWSIIRNYLSNAIKQPSVLVSALQIVEMQEIIDSQLLQMDPDASKVCKSWRKKSITELTQSIQNKFSPLLQKSAHLPSDYAELTVYLDEIFSEAAGLLKELKQSSENIRQCFPPHFGIIPFVVDEYSQQLRSFIDVLIPGIQGISTQMILHVLSWFELLEAMVTDMGGRFGKLPESIDTLISTYISRVSAKLDGWLQKLIEVVVNGDLDVSVDGKAITPGASDLFQLTSEQVNIVAESGIKGRLLSSIVKESHRVMRDFQDGVKQKISTSVHLDVVCAVANSNMHSYEAAKDFVQHIQEAGYDLDDGQGKDMSQGFVRLAEYALERCVSVVYSDPGFEALFHKIGHGEEWRMGVTMGSVLATLEDFMDDFQRLLQPELFSITAQLILSEALSHLLAAYLTYFAVNQLADVELLQRDAGSLVQFFAKHVPDDVLSREILPFSDLASFATADSEESFLLAYSSLLDTAPGITPTLLSAMLMSRINSDMPLTKAEAKEVLEELREVYNARQQDLGGGGSAAGKWSHYKYLGGASAAWAAALAAARKGREIKIQIL